MTPTLHMSTASSYISPVMISGATYPCDVYIFIRCSGGRGGGLEGRGIVVRYLFSQWRENRGSMTKRGECKHTQ